MKPKVKPFEINVGGRDTKRDRAVARRGATPKRNQFRDAHNRAKRSLEDKDAVEVVCRLTPYHGPTPCLTVLEENVIRCVPPPNLQKRDGSSYHPKNFEFGYVFDESDSQQEVFERCTLDLIEHLLDGKNGLLFTYGVTGSGKTYTMTGKPTVEETGLLPRTLDVLFNSIDNKVDRCVFYPNGRNGFAIRSKMEAHVARKQAEIERLQISSEIEQRYVERRVVPGYNDNYVCAVFVSYVEIYNNYCYDLLETKSTFTKRDTRLDMNNMVYVEGAREVEVEDSDEALQLFCKGEERRRTSDTLLNKESSRSHSVFTIRLVMAPFDGVDYSTYPTCNPSEIVVSQLSLVDLAGSERAKRTQNVGDRLAEAASINKSLMGTGKIRMIICANPKPADFEENLNVLAFAEESQTVLITRAEQRLEVDASLRGIIPHRFYSHWNNEIDNIVASLGISQIKSQLFHDLDIKDYNDYESINNLKEHCVALSEIAGRETHDLEASLRKVLCFADYAKVQIDELRARLENDSEQIACYYAENKKLKRELQSLRERLSRYEVHDEQMLNAEEQLRRSVKEERSRARKQDQKLKVIQDICDAPSPSFAQLRSKFSTGNDTPSVATANQKRKVVTNSQMTSSTKEIRQHEDPQTPASGPGYFNPKYHRRSKSAPRVLDHQPTNRVPTGGIFRVKLPMNTKQVTKPEAHQLQKSSDYVLTHQEVDEDGNISTSVVKGECIPTAGGGTAVLFNDVEQVSHKTPGRKLRN
ncbi:kinesin motor domain protein [Dictyocaulus viviparus]|uniref:Kinesin-like protein n=1 Tax=Dictyocaulus viviparus TaxID=29172 RepID=A0A0D8XM29_DICVI|nr:kinesin motor domain protein [Dictyocaulus viviparus]